MSATSFQASFDYSSKSQDAVIHLPFWSQRDIIAAKSNADRVWHADEAVLAPRHKGVNFSANIKYLSKKYYKAP